MEQKNNKNLKWSNRRLDATRTCLEGERWVDIDVEKLRGEDHAEEPVS